MNCEEAIAALIDAKENDYPAPASATEHLAKCEDCNKSIQEIEQLFSMIETEPSLTPPASIRLSFEKALTEEMNASKPVHPVKKTSIRFLAAACVILMVGVGIGMLIMNKKQDDIIHPAVATNVPARELAPSPSEKIDMINTSIKTSGDEDSLLSTLTGIVLNDKNPNVRMAALYALSKYTADEQVHHSLVAALKKESEPVIQVLLINMLTENKNNGAADEIRNLIGNKNTRKEVKMVAEQKLKSL